MKLRNTARIAVTAGLCLSMVLGGAPTAAFAEEAAPAATEDARATEQTPAADTVTTANQDAESTSAGDWAGRHVTFTFKTEDGSYRSTKTIWLPYFSDLGAIARENAPENYVVKRVVVGGWLHECVTVIVEPEAPKTATVTVKYWDENGVNADGETTGAEVPGAVQTHTLEIGKAYGDIFSAVPDEGYELEGLQTLNSPTGENVSSDSIVQGDATIYVHVKRKTVEPTPDPKPEARTVTVRFYDQAKQKYVGGTLEGIKLNDAQFNGGAVADITTIQELQTWIQSWSMQPNGYTFDDEVKIEDQTVSDKNTIIWEGADEVTFYVSAKRDPVPQERAVTVRFYDQDKREYVGGTLENVKLDEASYKDGSKKDIVTFNDLQAWIESWGMQPNGYTFNNDVKANDQVVSDKSVAIFTNTTDVTFYVTAESDPVSKVTVTFVDKFNDTKDSVEVEKGQAVAKPADPTHDGYTFCGWSTDAKDYVAYDFSQAVESDLTLYASYYQKNGDSSEKPEVKPEDNGKPADTSKKDAAKKSDAVLPQTGDNSSAAIAAVAVAGAAVIAAGVSLKRRQN